MKINKLEVQNFKGFELKDWTFNSNMTVLIGNNGSGKTSVLEALSIALGTFFQRIQGAQARTLKDYEKRRLMTTPESVEVQLPCSLRIEHSFEGENYTWCRYSNKLKGGFTYRDANLFINRGRELSEMARKGESVDLPLLSYYGTERLSEKKQKLAYAKRSSRIDGYYSALDPRSFKRKFLEWFKTFEDSALKFNKDRTLYNAFTRAISEMVPEWQNVHFSWESNDMMGQLRDESWMPFGLMSDGYRNIIRIAADIAYRAIKLNPHLGENAIKKTHGVVLIDEIDMHLHPKWQRHIINDFKRTFPNIQFIVTTHSPFIVQSLNKDEIINLDTDLTEGVEEFTRINPFQQSIEDIVENEMGINEVRRSNKFKRFEELAAKYFDLIESGKRSESNKELFETKKELDEIELEFSSDPIYTALMKAERKQIQ